MQASPDRESEPATDKPPTPHDALFKVLLGHPDRAAEFLQMHLPKRIRKLLSDAPPVLLDGHYVDEMLRYSQSSCCSASSSSPAARHSSTFSLSTSLPRISRLRCNWLRT